MPQKFPRWLIVVIVILIVFSFFGFLWRFFFWSTLRKTFSNSITGSSMFQTNISGGKTETNQDKPSQISLPNDFPKDKAYPGWKITTAGKMPQSNGRTITWVSGRTTDSREKIYKYYKDYFLTNGWTVSFETQNYEDSEIAASSGSKTLQVRITQRNNSDHSMVDIYY